MQNQADKASYISFCNHNQNIPLYFTPAWLDIVSGKGGWQAIMINNDGQIKAIFPYTIKKKYGLTLITLPQLTQYLGIYFVYPEQGMKAERKIAFENRISQAVIEKLPKFHYLNINFTPLYKNWLAFLWKDYRQTVRYTYIINTKSDETILWSQIKSKTKNIIRKAESNFKISTTQDFQTLIRLNKQTFLRQKKDVPYDSQVIENLFNHFSKYDKCSIQVATDQSDVSVAAIMNINDNKKSYCIFIGSNDSARKSGAVSLLIWHSIKSAKSNGLNYDFEGSIMPNIEPFFRSFGGEQVPYFNIKKTSNKFLESLLVLSNKI